jgi:hypothetical protein
MEGEPHMTTVIAKGESSALPMPALIKRATFLVNGEKIRLNGREVTGPEHLMKIIRAENERLQGDDITVKNSNIDFPPGLLWDARSLFPLLKYIFGAENVKSDPNEPTVHCQRYQSKEDNAEIFELGNASFRAALAKIRQANKGMGLQK